MFNNNIIIVNSYIPYYPKEKNCLHHTLLIEKYKRIQKDLQGYFLNVKLTNFDIIHHESRGDVLEHSLKYYQQTHAENFKNIPNQDEYNFISSAIKSRRDDIYIQRNVMKKHFLNPEIKEKFKANNIFLSRMEKNAHEKKIKKKYSECW